MAAANAELEQTVVRHIDSAPGYELLMPVGAGAAGTVYRARQIKLDRIVAVKVIQHHPRLDGSLAARFELEARALAKLHHPSIVQVYDCGQQGQHLFIAMELLEGEDLGQRIRRQGPLDEAFVWAIARQTASALAHAAEHGVVHRDIKPANLFLVKQEPGIGLSQDPVIVKVADFGLARVQRDLAHPETSGSGDGLVLGTPLYMAPEQYRTPALVDHRADIYALGATVYHALTGRQPFVGTTVWGVMVQKLERSPSFGADLSKASAELIAAMMAIDPEQRVGNYEELIRRIDALPAPNRPATATVKPTTFRGRNGKSRTRWPVQLMIVAAFMLATFGAIRLKWWPAGPTTRAADLDYRATGYQEALFSQQSLQGWLPTGDGGRWSVDKDEEGAPILTGTGFVRRIFTAPPSYRLTLGLDLHDAETVEIHFAIPQRSPELAGRLVLRITKKNGALLGIKAGSRGSFTPISSPVPFPAAEWFEGRRPYLEVCCVRTGATWSAWFHGQKVGWFDSDTAARSAEVQIWSGSGSARIDSVFLEKLETVTH
jgi:tRNA A-37 threonylcarbamoyl transferase component Bud32